MPTRRSRSRARSAALVFEMPRSFTIGRVSWCPIVNAGSRFDIGSCGM